MGLLVRSTLVVGVWLALVGGVSAQLKKATPELIDKDIKDLKAGGNARTFAFHRLDKYEAPLPEKQAEVAELLMKLVKADKSYDAMVALSVWATEAELKEIPEYLGSGDISKAAVYVYSKKRYPPVAKQLASYLEGGGGVRKDIIEALILIGPDAEEYVLPYLMSKNKDAVKHAVEILGRAGTKKSIEPLNTVAKDYEKKDKDIVAGAKTAVTKIEERAKGDKDK